MKAAVKKSVAKSTGTEEQLQSFIDKFICAILTV